MKVTKDIEKEYWEIFNSLTSARYNYEHTYKETEMLIHNRHGVTRFSSYASFKKGKSLYQNKSNKQSQRYIISL